MDRIPFTNIPCGCNNRKETLSKVNAREAAIFAAVLVALVAAGFYLKGK